MCLEVLAQVAENAPGKIGAKRLGELSGLVISNSRLDGFPALHFSVSGGCSPQQAMAIKALNGEAREFAS
jgi:hypothetical protein